LEQRLSVVPKKYCQLTDFKIFKLCELTFENVRRTVIMKKFVLLMLILGLATSAQAGFVFTVNGQAMESGGEITIAPSDEIELDLEIDEGTTLTGYGLDYILSNAQAELLTDRIEFPQAFDLASGVKIDEPQHVRISGGQLFSPAVQGPAVIMTDLYLHCLEATDVVLEIVVGATTTINGETLETGSLLYTLTIHQIPEPMTLTLLGLGGLFLVRRKK
jgi:hypothetical protein